MKLSECRAEGEAAAGAQKRKRRARVDCQNAVQLLAKAIKIEQCCSRGSLDGDQIAENALQLFSKPGCSNEAETSKKETSKASAADEEREELPSLADPSAIQEFFRKNKTRKLRDFISAQRPYLSNGQIDPSIPVDHPMRKILEHSDKGMSVKEALAKGFRNYKVRLPKKRILLDVDSGIGASMLYSLFASDSTEEISASPRTSGSTVHDIISNFVNAPDVAASSTESAVTETSASSTVKKEPIDSDSEANRLVMRNSYNADKVRESLYPLPPFFKLPLTVSKGYRGIYYVQGIRYVQFSTLMKDNILGVSLDIPMGFEINGEVATFSLNELLLANGIAINDPKDCKDLAKIFAPSVFLIQHAIADHLLWNCGPNLLNPEASLSLEHYLIPISLEVPPFACHKLQYFEIGLNAWYGHNEVFDPCTTVQESSPLSAAAPDSEDVKPVVDSKQVELSARQKGLVVTNFDTGATVEELSRKFGVPTETIESILLNRSEVIRDQITALMAETEDERDKQILQGSSRKRNRVRRTSFVGLNILMWRFFKDCRDNGIILNGKLLKEHAMMISRLLGLENFKGSEGWLDAFKRRHRIDLKNMSGVPVNYEETEDDKMEEDHDEDSTMSSIAVQSHNIDISQIQSSSEGTTAALLDCVEKATVSAPSAVASISNTKPLDLENLFRSTDGASAESSSSCESTFVNGTPHVHPVKQLRSRILPTTALDENGFIAAVVKSAAISVHDKELSSALETIRSYILANDSSAMPAFLELQLKLAAISREQNKREKQASVSVSQTKPAVQNGGCTG